MSDAIEQAQKDWAVAQEDWITADRKLIKLVQDLCPGVHRPVQHRDLQPPWCNSCQRTLHGERIG